MRLSVAIVGLALIAACERPVASPSKGGAERGRDPANAPAAVMSRPAGTVSAAAADWPVDNACALLGKDTVGAALGTSVESTALATTTATPLAERESRCAYRLEDAQQVLLTVRRTVDGAPPPPPAPDATFEAVTGVGRAAIWVPGERRLAVVLENGRGYELTLPADLGAKDPKTIALALATRVE